jgi:hypothetical protein
MTTGKIPTEGRYYKREVYGRIKRVEKTLSYDDSSWQKR